MRDIRDGKIDSAWSGTTAEFKSFMGREQFRAYVRAHRALSEPSEFSAAQAVSRNGLPMTEYIFRPRSGASTIKVLLAREQGQWKPERLTVE
ncbi:MAG: hypothetical protein IRY99_02320 [Isosphaeraceae bacterium]|nr:hypothetical protein [Isosphaeraceae bacterium]